MDFEKAKRRHNLKVIISEIIMVLTAVFAVVVLALITTGYWINEDLKVERQGMLQVISFPTGATVSIDGDSSWLQKTNFSKVLPVGEHQVSLSREGYDTWSKTITIAEGLLYRLQYPRLFPLEREKETIASTIGATHAYLSENREKLLVYYGAAEPDFTTILSYADNPDADDNANSNIFNPSEWQLFELKSHKIEPKTVSLDTIRGFQPSLTEDDEDIEDYAIVSRLNGSERLVFSKFYNDHYVTVIDGSLVDLYAKEAEEPTLEFSLNFTPQDVTVGKDGEFVVFFEGLNVATLDMESLTIREWSAESPIGWLNSNMIYTIHEGELTAYDFDGLNRRLLANNVSSHFPATIVGDDWLYYFSDDNLVRESLRAR